MTSVLHDLRALLFSSKAHLKLLDSTLLRDMQRAGWAANGCRPSTRALYWRLMLGVISSTDFTLWAGELSAGHHDYSALKKEVLPNKAAQKSDPLSMFAEEQEQRSAMATTSPQGWSKYHHTLAASDIINSDLDRLYLNGVDDDYFRQPERRLALYNVLMVWSARHEVTSYRQGMHEIAGTVLLVLEQEVDAWKDPISPDPGDKASELASSIKPHVTAASLEAHTFWIFERVMKDLEPLFDPTPDEETGMSKVVLYCSNIQDHLLREIDSVLFHYLDRQAIQAQLYGMRWSRLMLGREFEVTDSQVLKIWDYIFACCLKTPRAKAFDPLTMPAEDEEDIDINKLWIATNCKGPINPLLMALGNFMIGMLLHIRNSILRSDVNVTMGLLMRYPPVKDIRYIMDLGDMIRRGIIGPGGYTWEGSMFPADEDSSDPYSGGSVPKIPFTPSKNLERDTPPQSIERRGLGRLGQAPNVLVDIFREAAQPIKRATNSWTTAISSSIYSSTDDDGPGAPPPSQPAQGPSRPGARSLESKGLLASLIDAGGFVATTPSKTSDDSKAAQLERRNRFVADRLLMVASEMQRSSVFDDPESEARVRDESIARILLLASVLQGQNSESDFEARLAMRGGTGAAEPPLAPISSNADSFELSTTAIRSAANDDDAREAAVSGGDASETRGQADMGEANSKGVVQTSSATAAPTPVGLSSSYTPGPFKSPPPSVKRTIFTNRLIDSDDEFSPLSLK